MCGLQGRRWKTNIKFEGRPIGQWLTEHNMKLSSQRSNCSEALEQVQIQGVDTSSHVDLSPSTTDIDSGLTSHTRLPTNVATSKGRQDMVSPKRPSLQHPSVPEEIQPEHTVNQTTSEVEASMRNEIHSLRMLISALTTRVENLEERLCTSLHTIMSGEEHVNKSADNEATNVQQQVASSSPSHTHEQFLLLQTQVKSLTMQQQNIEKEKQREIRKC